MGTKVVHGFMIESIVVLLIDECAKRAPRGRRGYYCAHTIRGLTLRTLCKLVVDNRVEEKRKGENDSDSYATQRVDRLRARPVSGRHMSAYAWICNIRYVLIAEKGD